MPAGDVDDEFLQDLQKIEMPTSRPKQIPRLGSIVRWKYEWAGDSNFGLLYIVVGLKNESPDVMVVRVLNDPYKIFEFHASQLEPI